MNNIAQYIESKVKKRKSDKVQVMELPIDSLMTHLDLQMNQCFIVPVRSVESISATTFVEFYRRHVET